jgi:hypothetical protein
MGTGAVRPRRCAQVGNQLMGPLVPAREAAQARADEKVSTIGALWRSDNTDICVGNGGRAIRPGRPEGLLGR